jgi:hypothetical protein
VVDKVMKVLMPTAKGDWRSFLEERVTLFFVCGVRHLVLDSLSVGRAHGPSTLHFNDGAFTKYTHLFTARYGRNVGSGG